MTSLWTTQSEIKTFMLVKASVADVFARRRQMLFVGKAWLVRENTKFGTL